MSKFKDFFKGTTGKDVVLSLQHMFAMFGATVTVPLVVGMSIPLALFTAGIGTILFLICTKFKVPVFLGSSFAFMPGLITVFSQQGAGYSYNQVALAAMIALVLAGLIYVLFAGIIKVVGVQKVKKLFPPIVVGPIIIIIGMNLAGSIFWNDIIVNTVAKTTGAGGVTALALSPDSWKYWTTAVLTAVTIVAINAYAKPKSFLKVVPIVLGFLVGYIYGMCVGIVNLDPSSAGFIFSKTAEGKVLIFQMAQESWGFWGAWKGLDGALIGTAILCIVPIAIVTFMEHLGDISANSIVCNKDFMVDPGLHRTVLGDGIATMVSGLLGGPANTTYGENTAVLAITKNYNPRNIFYAACFAVVLGLFVPIGEFIGGIPPAVVGGACIVLFGMIAANGLRALVDGRVDFSDSKNLIVVSITLSVGLGLGAVALAGDVVSSVTNYTLNGNILKVGFSVGNGGFVNISALCISTLLAIFLNIIIPNSKEKTVEEEEAYENAPVTLMATVDEAVEDVIEEKKEEAFADEKATEEVAAQLQKEIEKEFDKGNSKSAD